MYYGYTVYYIKSGKSFCYANTHNEDFIPYLQENNKTNLGFTNMSN